MELLESQKSMTAASATAASSSCRSRRASIVSLAWELESCSVTSGIPDDEAAAAPLGGLTGKGRAAGAPPLGRGVSSGSRLEPHAPQTSAPSSFRNVHRSHGKCLPFDAGWGGGGGGGGTDGDGVLGSRTASHTLQRVAVASFAKVHFGQFSLTELLCAGAGLVAGAAAGDGALGATASRGRAAPQATQRGCVWRFSSVH